MGPATTFASVTPALLLWAREESGYSAEAVARRLGVKVERLFAWESGERQPTVRQATALAGFYRRPLGVFFLPQPPRLPPVSSEFRRLTGVRPGGESPELRLALREISLRREEFLELSEELNYAATDFELRLRTADGPERAGEQLRAALGFAATTPSDWKDGWTAWGGWRRAAEDAGVLVFQFSGVALDEVRGLSLLHFPMPVAAINSSEGMPEARVFTLLHELTHLALAAAREQLPAMVDRRDDASWLELERFVEATAAAALMPRQEVFARLNALGGRPAVWDIDTVRRLARRFFASPLATATRLWALEQMSWDEYHAWRTMWEAAVAGMKSRRVGAASPAIRALSRGGLPFARLVLEALDANRITAARASRQLGIKFAHFDALRIEVRHRSRQAASNPTKF